MARSLSAGMITEINATTLSPIVLVEGEFASGFLRLWSGIGDLSYDGKNWTGAGNLLKISEITEANDIRAIGTSITISGIPASLISLVLTEARQGKAGRIYIGALDSSGAVIASPYLAFSGRLDVPSFDAGGDTTTITISYESRLIDLEKPRLRRFTPEDQKIEYPNDKGFDFVPSLQDKQIYWGRT